MPVVFKKYILPITLLLFIFFVNGIKCIAQEKKSVVYGTVKEKESNSPLPNVNVFVSGTTLGAATDSNGNFEIMSVPQGNHNIVASIVGYQPEVRQIDVEEKDRYLINFVLEQKAYEFQTVEITGKVSDEWKSNLNIFKKVL